VPGRLGWLLIDGARGRFSGTMKFIDTSGTATHIAQKGLPMPFVLALVAAPLKWWPGS
jgi:hypothetical protein